MCRLCVWPRGNPISAVVMLAGHVCVCALCAYAGGAARGMCACASLSVCIGWRRCTCRTKLRVQ